MPARDPIIEEVRANRDEYSKRFDYDVDAMVEDLRRQQERSGRSYVSRDPQKPARRMPVEKKPAA